MRTFFLDLILAVAPFGFGALRMPDEDLDLGAARLFPESNRTLGLLPCVEAPRLSFTRSGRISSRLSTGKT